jgi:hypothetical protein
MGSHEAKPAAPGHSQLDVLMSKIALLGQKKPVLSPLRRIPASEPEIRSYMPSPRSVRQSKSTFAETDQRISEDNWRRTKDALTKVSVAEDLASLVALAHALDEEHEDPKLHPDTSEKATTGEPAKQDIECHLPKFNGEHDSVQPTLNKEWSDFVTLAGDAVDDNARREVRKKKHNTTARSLEARSELSLKAKYSKPVQPKSLESANLTPAPNFLSLTKSAPSPKRRILGHVNESPQISVKKLAAKFNNDELRSLSTPPPAKSLSKSASIATGAWSDSPKEKVIASYTTNTPSPNKSQKSGLSGVSFRSVRIRLPTELSAAKVPTVRRLLRSDNDDSTPLGFTAQRELLLHGSDSTQRFSPSGSPQRLLPYDGPSAQPSGPYPTFLHDHSRHKEAPWATEIAMARPNAAKTESAPEAINSLLDPPAFGSNSLLHAQIRNLQQLLQTKVEEMCHLKRQLDTRGNFDIGALNKELSEAKKEVQIWKTRAGVAEKQVQMMASIFAGKSSHKAGNILAVAHEKSLSVPSRSESSENVAVLTNRFSRLFSGLDGNISPLETSESSTETVVRDTSRNKLATRSQSSL